MGQPGRKAFEQWEERQKLIASIAESKRKEGLSEGAAYHTAIHMVQQRDNEKIIKRAKEEQ